MGFFEKIKQGLKRTKESIGEGLNGIFATFRKVDEDLLEELTAKKQSVRLRTVKLEMSKLRDYFPVGTPEEVVKQTIHTALAIYFEGKNDS